MDFSLQSLASTPLKVQQGTRREPLSCGNASQLGMLLRRSQMRGVRCRVVEEGGEAAHKNSPAKDGAPASWLHPDSASDPFLGWTSDNSQPNHSSKAGWIKVGGALVLGIGFAVGTRTLYARQGHGTTSESTCYVYFGESKESITYAKSGDFLLQESMHIKESVTFTQQGGEVYIDGVLRMDDPMYWEALHVVAPMQPWVGPNFVSNMFAGMYTWIAVWMLEDMLMILSWKMLFLQVHVIYYI